MFIAITGHTSGIGKELSENLDGNIIGFSRSNGYDINQNISRIIEESKDCDIFINNAHANSKQMELLYSLYELWKGDETKTIINISSNSGDGIKTHVHPYAVFKSALDKTVEQLQNIKETRCKIINLRPGLVDTPRVKHITGDKMYISNVVDIVKFVLAAPNNILIKNLTFVPRS